MENIELRKFDFTRDDKYGHIMQPNMEHGEYVLSEDVNVLIEKLRTTEQERDQCKKDVADSFNKGWDDAANQFLDELESLRAQLSTAQADSRRHMQRVAALEEQLKAAMEQEPVCISYFDGSMVHNSWQIPLPTIGNLSLYAAPIPQQSPAVPVPDQPKNPGAAYLQTFLNDSRFDAAVNSMPDSLIEKFHGRIVERTADRDDWKLYASNLEEDIAKLQSPAVAVHDNGLSRLWCDTQKENELAECGYADRLASAVIQLYGDISVLKENLGISGVQSPRITEQDAREIGLSAYRYWMNNCDRTIDNWVEDEVVKLLNKLNREPHA